MTRFVHPIAGGVAMLMIATFWIATATAEISGVEAWIVRVKTAIPWGLLVLIPALMAVGGSGFALARGRHGALLAAKRSRMPAIAANGLVVLVPAALFLAARARASDFDTLFYSVQLLELIAGAVNFGLLALNMRDGFRMTRARRMTARATTRASMGGSGCRRRDI